MEVLFIVGGLLLAYFFYKLATGKSRAPAEVVPLSGDGGRYGQEVVGESFYTKNIAHLDKRLGTPDKATFCRARLVLDDGNSYDALAVRVEIDGLQVGHLSRQDARTYREALRKLGYPTATGECAAKILNYGDDIYSVWLDL